MGKRKLIYIAPGKSAFVLQDIEWLKKEFHVRSYFFEVPNKFLLPLYILKLFWWLLKESKAPILISFGGYHSYIGVLVSRLKKQDSYIILNGTDSVSFDEINYGYLKSFPIGWFCRKSYEKCTMLLPVSDSLMFTENDYYDNNKRSLGIQMIIPDLKTPYKVIPNGFDLNFWIKSKEVIKVEKTFVSVIGHGQERRKGLDLILEISQIFTDCEFFIAGHNGIDDCPGNVRFLGRLNSDQLKDLYGKCRYYLQLSIYEGFGCALCEAMLCGCIPVVSNVNVLPQISGPYGYIVTRRSAKELEMKIDEALSAELSVNCNVSEHIEIEYPIESRINQIKQIIH